MTASATERQVGAPAAARTHRVPALDGVRGIAIAAVLLFHTDSVVLQAGYLGVDVFFVLSGFLIADILYRGLSGASLHAVLSGFWLRRARRLAPALLILITVVCLTRLVSPQPSTEARGPILAALTYTTNWYEIHAGSTYFGQFQTPSMLFHTWSLAIEEQFYLAFPLVLVVVMRMVRTRRRVAVALAVLALLSMAWMFTLQSWNADALRIYMGTDTRVQALLVGGALGVLFSVRTRSTTKVAPRVSGVVGLMVLAVVMAFVDDVQVLFKGGFFLVAVGAGMVIISALYAGPIQTMLSWGPLIWLGRISYSLYLWHYPIFDWVQGGVPGTVPLGAQLWSGILSVLVAWLSYRLIEQPFLRGRFVTWPVSRQWLSYAVAALAVVSLVLAPAGLRERAPSLEWPAAAALPRSILVMGDSTGFEGDRYFPRDVYPEMVVGGTHFIGCGMSALPYRLGSGETKDVTECQQWPQRTAEYHRQWGPGAAVISSVVWDAFDRVVDGNTYGPGTSVFDEDFTDSLANAIMAAGEEGRIPVYVLEADCDAAQFEGGTLNDPQRRNRINRLVEGVVAGLPNAHAVDTSWLTCRDGKPAEDSGDSWVRRDGVHWSEAGWRAIWQHILSDIASRQ